MLALGHRLRLAVLERAGDGFALRVGFFFRGLSHDQEQVDDEDQQNKATVVEDPVPWRIPIKLLRQFGGTH